MIQPRWRKVISDLWSNKTRTLLVALSIGVGVFAVGMVSSMYLIFIGDLDADYASVNPRGARLFTDLFDDSLLKTTRRVPGVAEAEGRSSLSARVRATQGNWKPIQMTAIPPLNEMSINRLRQVDPTLRLGDRDILIERSALSILPVKVGDTIQLELPNKTTRQMRVAGIVHDVTIPSVIFTGQVIAFIKSDTMAWLGGPRNFNQMLITVSERKHDEGHVKEVARLVKDHIEQSGRQVYVTVAERPGEHPIRNIVQTLTLVLMIMGLLLIGLSSFLVVNTITALLAQHTRQIGVMKAVGARGDQIVFMYAALVLGFGFVAWLLSVPTSAFLGYKVAEGMADLMNFNLAGFRIPPGTLVVQTIVSLVTPLVAAVIPVLRGTRITVREAISSYGLGQGQFGNGVIDRLLEHIRFLSRPILISLRNTFRRKARLLLTLSTLTLGGAIFIGVFNLKAAFDVTIAETLGYVLSDINVSLGRAYRVQQIESLALSVPGVERIEYWAFANGQLLSRDQQTSDDVTIVAPPAGSTLIQPVLTAGRWLIPGDENAIVIGNHVIAKRPDLKVGDEVVTRMNDKEYTWHIVGIFKMAGQVIPPIVYANREYVAKLLNDVGRSGNYRIVIGQSDPAMQASVAKALQQTFSQAGISVSDITTGAEEKAQQAVGTDILVYFLLVMALLIALVGGIGLMGTMSMNVLERTREIGVLRSVGASNGAIMRLVLVEGLLIGLISWLLGVLLGIPLGKLMSDVVGVAFVTTPLTFVFSLEGVVIWLVIVLVLATLASVMPAFHAVRLTVRDVLAYE